MSEALATLVRAFIAFSILLIYTRILGKQQVSQLTLFDYVIGITVGSITATMSSDLSIRLFPQLVGLTAWMGLAIIMQTISVKSRRLAKILDGEPVIVVQNGQILEKNLSKVRLKTTDLMEGLREKGAFNIADVEFAILESDGNVSVLKKSQFLPITPNDLNISTQYKGVPTELIVEGEIVKQNLEEVNLDEAWLFNQLRNQGITDIKDIVYAHLDTTGKLYIDKFADTVIKPPDISDYKGPS